MAADTPAQALDAIDARLLDLVQRAIPLVERPFAELGRLAGINEEQCLLRLAALRDQRRIIRQISAIFDTQALGYESSLVAARYPAERLAEAAAVISGHPGVSHNYERSAEFNLWYTLAVPPAPDSRLGLEGTLARLHALSGALATRALPTLRLFKIGVRLAMGEDEAGVMPPADGAGAFTEADRAIARHHALTPEDRRMVGVLQQHLELIPEPFAAWARQAGCTTAELLAAGRHLLERRQMRRFAAVLRHREAGYSANVMGVWQVADAEVERVGAAFAACPAVSHCYLRPAYDDWPFNMYTMVHGRSREQCLATLEELRSAGNVQGRAVWSVREFKKTRVRYFTGETAEWEARFGQG